jgi:hypothetical protein
MVEGSSAERCGKRGDACGAAVKAFDKHVEQVSVERSEAKLVYFKHAQAIRN